MKLRKQGLTVSTFPFLAVMLCAMGSLILILLVIDRRARAVVQARAQKSAEQGSSLQLAAEEKARAEFEQRRQQLRDQLAAEFARTEEQTRAVQAKSQSAGADLSRAVGLQKQADSQAADRRASLELAKAGLQARNLEIQQTENKVQLQEAEVARLAEQLRRLEGVLSDLKDARKHRKELYSVVPYRGRRGDGRRPLYAECTDNSVVFHPGKQVLSAGPGFAALVRAELNLLRPTLAAGNVSSKSASKSLSEKGSDPLHNAGSSPQSGEDTAGWARGLTPFRKDSNRPYLLLLVRPNGIATYYKTVAALKDTDVDFGYELIEKDWVLEFPDHDESIAAQPWQVAQPGSMGPAVGPKRGHALRRTSGESASGRPNETDPALPPVNPLSSLAPAKSIAVQQGTPGRPGLAGDGVGKSAREANLPNPPSAELGSIPGANALSGNLTREAGSAVQRSDAAVGVAPAERNPRQPGPVYAPGQPQGGAGGQPAKGTSRTAKDTGQGDRPSSLSGPGPASEVSTVRKADEASEPRPGRPADTERPSPSGVASPVAEQRKDRDRTDGERAEETAIASLPDPSARLVAKDKNTRQPSAGKETVLITRSWTIVVECSADGIELPASGDRYSLAELASAKGSKLFRDRLSGLIDRRQATVRRGDPPYRPIVRFRIRPTGLRAYYLAYPAVEPLGISMTREDAD